MIKIRIKKFLKLRQRGIALLMVLSAIAILSAVVTEFAYNSNVSYNLAMNEVDRLQAYYLAQSGINFGKILIKYDKEAKKVAKEASKKMGRPIEIPPLYEMIPINTGMIRGLAGLGEETGEEDTFEETADEGGEDGSGEPSALEQGMSFIDLKGAEEFLAFKGDFSAEVTEEESKLNLNAFYSISPKDKSYDRLKGILYHLLATDEFSGLFDDRYRGAKQLAQDIADFIDKDDVQNELGGEQRGREGASGGNRSPGKNGKLVSVEELMLVPGVTEEVFQKLKPFVTIYGGDEKVYVCRAQDPLVKALIISYTENNPKMEPVKDDNAEMLDKALEEILNNCPDKQAMAKALDSVIGVVEDDTSKSSSSTSTSSAEGKTSSGKEKEKQKKTTNSFEDLIKDEATVFTIVGTGIVGDSEVNLKTVVDTSKGNPKQWKEIYWRVE